MTSTYTKVLNSLELSDAGDPGVGAERLSGAAFVSDVGGPRPRGGSYRLAQRRVGPDGADDSPLPEGAVDVLEEVARQ
jgi:hypothetical protein